jgi:branched-chain amino acid transport system substrate-binding protein
MKAKYPMRKARLLILILGLGLGNAASAATLGIVAPQSGPYELLGAQIRQGAKAAAAAAGLDIVEIHESCDPGSGGAIADGLTAAKISVAVGFLCTETLTDAMTPLRDANIPVITLSSRASILMEDALKQNWPLFRFAPSEKAESDKLSDVILRDWQGASFALIDDGTIHGRELVDRIKNTLEENGLKPMFTDTYRPAQEQQIALVRRLSRTGITHVFIGGDRNDVSIIARDATSENIALTILGGDAMSAANRPVPLQEGVLAVTIPDYSALPSAASAIQALKTAGVEADGYALPAFAAAEVAAKAIDFAQKQEKPVADLLRGSSFETAIGHVGFNNAHELSDNPYRLQRWNGTAFTEVPASQ